MSDRDRVHRHHSGCYDDPGPGHGPPQPVCGLVEGVDLADPEIPEGDDPEA